MTKASPLSRFKSLLQKIEIMEKFLEPDSKSSPAEKLLNYHLIKKDLNQVLDEFKGLQKELTSAANLKRMGSEGSLLEAAQSEIQLLSCGVRLHKACLELQGLAERNGL